MTLSIRRTLASVHRWTGMSIGVVAAFFALTGLGLVFRPQLQPVVDHALQQSSRCDRLRSLDELIASSRSVHPSGALRQLELTSGGRGTTVIRYADLQGVYVDACTGVVLGQQERWGGLFGTIEKLHRWRFLEDADRAELFAGCISLAMGIVLVLGGLVLWWPRSRAQLRAALRPPRGLSGLALDVKLHRTLGAYAAVVLLVSAMASWTMSFDWARHAVYGMTQSPPPAKKPRAVDAGGPASAEALLSRTLQLAPGADTITIAYPRKAGDPVEVGVIEHDAPHPNARTVLYLDPASARVLRYEPYSQSPIGYKVYRWLVSLHMGYVGGLFGQAVLFCAMACIPVLVFTGIRSWLRRKYAGSRLAARRV